MPRRTMPLIFTRSFRYHQILAVYAASRQNLTVAGKFVGPIGIPCRAPTFGC